MSPDIAKLRAAVIFALIACIPARAADIVVQPAIGSGFAVKDASGAQVRLRVDENGQIVMPILVNGTQQSLPVCVGSGGQVGPCAAGSGGSFSLPYSGTVATSANAFAVANTGAGNALNGMAASATGVNGQSATGSGVHGLSGAASGANGAAGVWGDASNYFGVWGTSVSADGVHGDSQTSSGVFGGSKSGAGVWAESQGYDAVHGHTSNPGGNTSGVAGFGDGNNNGVAGIGTNGNGVFGVSDGAGVWGESTGYDAIHGHTSNLGGNASGVAGFGDGDNNGVAGISKSGSGVFGTTSTGAGIYGHSDSGYGIATDGPVQQARDQGGWVKAMALVDGGGGQILRCFNSGEDRAHASTPPCGMWVDGSRGFGLPSVCFPFEVDDRFFQISPVQVEITSSSQSPTQATYFAPYGSNCATVFTSDSSGTYVEAQFFIVVF